MYSFIEETVAPLLLRDMGRNMEQKYIGPNYKIFELMRERGISQKELSKRTGIPTSTISDWKQKGTVPSSDKIIAICKALNVRVDEVFEQIEKDETNQRVITKQDDLWEFVCEYDEMEPAKKKRLLSYMMALLKVERDKNDGVSSEEKRRGCRVSGTVNIQSL